MLFVLIAVCVISVPIALIQPRWDRGLAWFVGLVLVLLSGLRTGGFDYDEYLTMIESVRAADEFAVRLLFAKDPFFLMIIDVCGLVTEDVWLVFLVVAVLSVMTKVLATAIMPGRRTLFMALYAVFLAPGYEFAAIRAGLAVGFMLLAVSRTGFWRWVWALFGVASHSSAAAVAAGLGLRQYPRLAVLGMVATLPVALSLLIRFGQDDPRYSSYFGAGGTTFALILPAVTAAVLGALVPPLRQVWLRSHGALRDAALGAAVCIAAALALALPFVAVSFRLLEMSWPLILVQLSILSVAPVRGVARVSLYGAWALMVIILSTSNFLRSTWFEMPGMGT